MNNEYNGQGRNLQQDQENERGKSNTIKNPDDWTTGDEPMTGAQQSYLKTLSDEAGEELPVNLTKAEASKKIDELQQKTGRGFEQKNSNETENNKTSRSEDPGYQGSE